MSIVFPAGKNKVGWVSSPEEIEAKLQKQASVDNGEFMAEDAGIEADPQFDAIKDLPCICDEAEKLEGEISGGSKDVAEEVKAVVEEAVEKATEAVQEVVEKVEKIVEKVEDKVEVADEGKKDEKADEVVLEVAEEPMDAGAENKDDEIVVEVEVEPETKDEIPGGTVGEDGKEGKKDKEGCMAATKSKKVEAKAVVSADDTSKFVKISKLSPENKSDLKDFWSTIFPAEYVNAMLKDY